jgi:hypothetical protein
MPHARCTLRRLIVVVSSLLAACSSGGGGLDINSFNKQSGIAQCVWSARCGQIGASEEKQCETDVATGAAKYPSAYSINDAIAKKRVKFSSSGAQACLDAIGKAGCSVDAYFDLLGKCGSIAVGLVPVGGACLDYGECVPGSYCDQGAATSSGCMGTCKANLTAGTTCDPNNDLCDSTSACDATSMKCVARVGTGQTCGDSPQCTSDLFCKGYTPSDSTTMPPTPEVPGTCKGPGAVGEACTSGFFGNTDCALGLYCNDSLASPVCAQLLALGADCDSFYACTDPNTCIGLNYDMNNMVIKGKCGPYLDVGGMCTADPNAFITGCPNDTTCDATSKLCKASAGKLGDTCDAMAGGGTCGTNLYCDGPTTKCAAAVAFGGACVPPTTDANGNTIGDEPCHDGSCSATSKTCALNCSM